MEIECSKCQRKFHSVKEDEYVCPDCLRNEFTAEAPRLDDKEHAELVAEYKASMRRQSARAEVMGGIYTSGQAFSIAGKLRFVFGVSIFLICGFLFLISDKRSGLTFLAELDIESQRLFSMILCGVAAVLVATASIRFKILVRVLACVLLAMGWFLPDMLAYEIRKRERQEAAAAAADRLAMNQEQLSETIESSGPVLTEEDLQVFTTLKRSSSRVSNYAVFIDNHDGRVRDLVRATLNRLLQAQYTQAYTRANGALYVSTNVPGDLQNISRMLTRFGTVTYAKPDKGIYEVRFDAERANVVSPYSTEVLTSPMNNAYVTANLHELKCLDPLRVRMSARSLVSSNVGVLRGEIRDVLVEVLREPWATEPDTYCALIEALVTYCKPGDKQAVRFCLEYFEARRSIKRDIAPAVTEFLIREVPESMVDPIIDFWCENPIAWSDKLNLLGYRVQTPLLDRLSKSSNIRLITTILKYLEDRGTSEALPVVENFLEYPDSVIRHSARTTYKAIQSRSR